MCCGHIYHNTHNYWSQSYTFSNVTLLNVPNLVSCGLAFSLSGSQSVLCQSYSLSLSLCLARPIFRQELSFLSPRGSSDALRVLRRLYGGSGALTRLCGQNGALKWRPGFYFLPMFSNFNLLFSYVPQVSDSRFSLPSNHLAFTQFCFVGSLSCTHIHTHTGGFSLKLKVCAPPCLTSCMY